MKPKNQSGYSMLSLIIIVVLVVGGLLLTMKLVPLYITDFAVGKALNSLEAEKDLINWKKKDIRETIRKKLSVDYSRSMKDEEIIITKKKDNLSIDIIYEERIPVVYNLDIIAKFNHHLEKNK